MTVERWLQLIQVCSTKDDRGSLATLKTSAFPLHQHAQIMKLQGLPVDRSTLAEFLLSSAKIAVDQTRAPVLNPGSRRTKTGYFWAISRDDGWIRSSGRRLYRRCNDRTRPSDGPRGGLGSAPPVQPTESERLSPGFLHLFKNP
jgi:hypothetical protein